MERTLNPKEFAVLQALEASDAPLTQRVLAGICNMSVGTVNKLAAQLSARGLAAEGRITDQGRAALEPYRVKRAVLIAAGFGERLMPITLNTPKPLVRVRGERIIDSLLDALGAAEIEEVYIVRGYLKEQFDQLLHKYPNIAFIDNDQYNEANNISSIVAARDKLSNAYIFESDILLANPTLITKYQYQSNYLGIPVDRTDDWCFKMKHGSIDQLTLGGVDGYQMCGLSYWTEDDGARLAEDALAVWNMPGGKECFWDEIPLRHCRGNYRVSVRECDFSDLVEIDTFKELHKIDPAYCV